MDRAGKKEGGWGEGIPACRQAGLPASGGRPPVAFPPTGVFRIRLRECAASDDLRLPTARARAIELRQAPHDGTFTDSHFLVLYGYINTE